MSRHRQAIKREVPLHIVYQDKVVSKFLSKLMQNGKRNLAENIFKHTLEIIEDKLKQDPIELFNKAIKNVRPVLEVKSRRVGGSTYQVPVEVKKDRSLNLAMRWILANSQSKKGRPMHEKLAQELMDAANGVGASIKKKEDTHRMADANKAFSHFRW